jgi:hypothetical protein
MSDFEDLMADATAEAERAAAEAAPAPDPAPAASVEADPAPADATPAANDQRDPDPDPAPSADQEQEPWYKTRINTLTERRDRERAAREAAEARVRELEAIVQGHASADPAAPAPAPAQPAPRTFTEAEVAQRAAEIAAANEFNNRCNAIFEEGVKAYGQDFQKAVGNLNTAGLISLEDQTLLRAVMDSDNPALVLNHLGKDPGEAQKLLAMSPYKMGAELARMSERLSKPAQPAPISKAPAPITPIGAATPRDTVNLADDSTSDSDFFAEFEKQLARR